LELIERLVGLAGLVEQNAEAVIAERDVGMVRTERFDAQRERLLVRGACLVELAGPGQRGSGVAERVRDFSCCCAAVLK
jgi:hypothetical protein